MVMRCASGEASGGSLSPPLPHGMVVHFLKTDEILSTPPHAPGTNQVKTFTSLRHGTLSEEQNVCYVPPIGQSGLLQLIWCAVECC